MELSEQITVGGLPRYSTTVVHTHSSTLMAQTSSSLLEATNSTGCRIEAKCDPGPQHPI